MTRINRCALKGSQNGVMDQLELLFFKLLLVISNDVHLFITFLIERCLEYLLCSASIFYHFPQNTDSGCDMAE